jgi:hypothetical protein
VSSTNQARGLTTPWGRPTAATDGLEQALRDVGLCEEDARIAAEGLVRGRYLSLEDAVQSRVTWGQRNRNKVDEKKLLEAVTRQNLAAIRDGLGTTFRPSR